MGNKSISTKNEMDLVGFIEWWRIKPEEIEYQVNNYNNFKQSYRGQAVLIIVFLLFINIVLSVINLVPFNTVVVLSGTLIYSFLAYLVKKGNRFAIVSTMVLYSIEKAYAFSFINADNIITIVTNLVMWALLMRPLLGAIKVENKLRKMTKDNNTHQNEQNL